MAFQFGAIFILYNKGVLPGKYSSARRLCVSPPQEKTDWMPSSEMTTTPRGMCCRHSPKGLLLLGSAILLCAVLGQSHTVDAIVNGQLGPLAPNSPLSLQADPNFLRFGRSGPYAEFAAQASPYSQAKRASNFLRFGKSPAPVSEPNFLRFGRHKGFDPSFLRFGRAPSNNNFLRFGRGDAEGKEAFEREYRQPNPNFLRFG